MAIKVEYGTSRFKSFHTAAGVSEEVFNQINNAASHTVLERWARYAKIKASGERKAQPTTAHLLPYWRTADQMA